jgi:hypothetical protein
MFKKALLIARPGMRHTVPVARPQALWRAERMRQYVSTTKGRTRLADFFNILLEGLQHMVRSSGLFENTIAARLRIIAKLQWSFP